MYASTPPLATTSGTAQATPPAASAATGRDSSHHTPARRCHTIVSSTSGIVSHIACDRMPMDTPAMNAPHGSHRRSRLPFASIASATRMAASPSMSLIGRSPVIQNNGAAAISAVPQNAAPALVLAPGVI